MGKIQLSGIEIFAYHGHYEEEKYAGNNFRIDITLWTDTQKAEISDNLDDALNYQVVYAIVKDIVLNTKYNLLERLARVILDSFFEEFKQLEKAKIYIQKINPPLGGAIESVGVEILKENVFCKKCNFVNC